MPKSHFNPHIKEMMGKDFAELLREIAPFVEPRADIIKTNRRLAITIDAAGASAEDMSISQKNRTLIIEGKIKPQPTEEEQEWIARERFYGPFKREIAIPEEYDLHQIHAKFESGILTVTIPYRTNEKGEEQ
ncbi:Hsp20/alpha crystallin family protein [Bacillus subtilis]|uniref:Hsp20/alpha crystallin family protein n=1 Tax=Bacillus subtilis TaxID=1423 RepID=UPI00300059E7